MYKMNNPIDEGEHEWSFIGGVRRDKESLKEALLRVVEREIGVKVDGVELVSENFYHARLTDDNVNRIKRDEGQLLDFFTLSDLQKLHLEEATKSFTSRFGNLITPLPAL